MPPGLDCVDCQGQFYSPTCSEGRWACAPRGDCADVWTSWVTDEAPFTRGEQVDRRVCAARPRPGQLDQALGPFPRASATTGGARLEVRNETGAAVSVYLANGNFGPMELTLGQPALITQPYGHWWCGQDPGLHVDPSAWTTQLDAGGFITVDLGGVVARLGSSGCYEWADLPAGCYRVEFCTFPQGPFRWPATAGACAKTVISLEPGVQTRSTLSLR